MYGNAMTRGTVLLLLLCCFSKTPSSPYVYCVLASGPLFSKMMMMLGQVGFLYGYDVCEA